MNPKIIHTVEANIVKSSANIAEMAMLGRCCKRQSGCFTCAESNAAHAGDSTVLYGLCSSIIKKTDQQKQIPVRMVSDFAEAYSGYRIKPSSTALGGWLAVSLSVMKWGDSESIKAKRLLYKSSRDMSMKFE